MKNKSLLILSALLGLWVLSTNAGIEEEMAKKSKKATRADVLGTWEMIHQDMRPGLNTNSMFFAQHQILQFREDDFASHITSNKPLEPGTVKALLETMPRKTTYKFVADGYLVIIRSEKDGDNIMAAVITDDVTLPLRKDAPLLKKDTLLFSYLDQNRQLYMQRYFRKIDLK